MGGGEEGRKGMRKERREGEDSDSLITLSPSSLSAASPPQTGQSSSEPRPSRLWCFAAHSPPLLCALPPAASPADALEWSRDRHRAWHGTWTSKSKAKRRSWWEVEGEGGGGGRGKFITTCTCRISFVDDQGKQ